MEKFDNKILIVRDKEKNRIIKNKNRLVNSKIITLSELKKKYYFDYSKKTIYYVCQKYNVIYDVAKKYIGSLYYVNKDSSNKKIHFLYELKQELLSKKLLIENKLFREFLHNKEIILYDVKNIDKFYQEIFDEISKYSIVSDAKIVKNKSKKKLYSAFDKEEEIAFVASEICMLIKKGININNIKLANVKKDYVYSIKQIFKLFNIPVVLDDHTSIKGTNIVKTFKNNYSSDINQSIEKLKKDIKTQQDEIIFNKIIGVVNEYAWCDNYLNVKDLLLEDIDNLTINSIELANAVRIIDFENEIVNDEEYIFLINYNEGIIPTNYKDEDYLNDKEKEFLKVSDSNDLNNKARINIQEKIKNTCNLVVTYALHDKKKQLFISSSYSDELFDKNELVIPLTNSNKYNKIRLVSLNDQYRKFGTTTNEYFSLLKHYNNEKYLEYDNKYKMINNIKLRNQLNNEITLSYSTLNTFNECGFKYYISNILRIDKFVDSFDTVLGNVFHHILSKCFNDDFNYEEAWQKEMNNITYEMNNSEKFFISNLKSELQTIIKIIKSQLKYTQLDKNMYEKNINIDVNSDLHIRFKGFVDKILYKDDDTNCVAVIIDYKTGNPKTSIAYVDYGLQMQLPCYLYLVKNSNIIKNVTFGGFYLQKLLNNKNSIEEKEEALMLEGYSNADKNILELVDSNYENSKMIKGIRVTNSGDFSSKSKVLTNDQINELIEKVGNNIIASGNKILNGEFEINPKKIKNTNYGCEYCQFKDICFMKEEDIILINTDKSGGDNDGMDE